MVSFSIRRGCVRLLAPAASMMLLFAPSVAAVGQGQGTSVAKSRVVVAPTLFDLPGSAAELAGLAVGKVKNAANPSITNDVIIVFASQTATPMDLAPSRAGLIHNLVIQARPVKASGAVSQIRLNFIGAPEKSGADFIEDTSAVNGTLEVVDSTGATVMKTNNIASYRLSGAVPDRFELVGEAVVDQGGIPKRVGFSVTRQGGPLAFSVKDLASGAALASGSYNPGTLEDIVLTQPIPTGGGNVKILDRVTGKVIRTFSLAGQMGGSVWDGSDVWQIVYGDSKIVRLNLETGGVAGAIPTPGKGHWGGIAFDGQDFWVHGRRTSDRGYVLAKVRRSDGTVIRELAADPSINGLAWLKGKLYAATNGQELRPKVEGSAIRVVDLETGALKDEFSLPPGLIAHELEADGDALLLTTTTDAGFFNASITLKRFVIPLK